jgi:hypothetical protein
MNERIEQFANDAHEQALNIYRKRMETEFPGDVFFYKIYNSLFAELIVRECLEIVDVEGCGEGGSVRSYIKIKEHFGVES